MDEPDVLDEDKERRPSTTNEDIGQWLLWLSKQRRSVVMLSERAMIKQIEAHFIDVLDRGDYDEDSECLLCEVHIDHSGPHYYGDQA